MSGLLVTCSDPEDYASAVRRVLERRELLAAGARRHAAGFSWDRTTDSLVQGYAAAMAEMRSTARPAGRTPDRLRAAVGLRAR